MRVRVTEDSMALNIRLICNDFLSKNIKSLNIDFRHI